MEIYSSDLRDITSDKTSTFIVVVEKQRREIGRIRKNKENKDNMENKEK